MTERAFNPHKYLVHSSDAPGTIAPGVAVARRTGVQKDVTLWEGLVCQRGQGSKWLCAFSSHTHELVEVDEHELSVAAWRYSGRLRLVLWLAQKHGVPLGCVGPLWESAGFAWRLGDLEAAQWYVGSAKEAAAHPDGTKVIPSLVGLYGYDCNALLPDRTREVDTLALKLVVEHGW